MKQLETTVLDRLVPNQHAALSGLVLHRPNPSALRTNARFRSLCRLLVRNDARLELLYYQYLARSTRLLDQPVGSLDGALALHPVYDTWVHTRNLPLT